MGTQQILLIVLSVIIVGIAVAVGISMFNTQSDAAELQAVAGDLQSFGAQILAYLKTPTSMGGGGAAVVAGDAANIATWIGWSAVTLTNSNATYTLTTALDAVTITANNTAASAIVIDDTDTSMADVVTTL